jgi:hypothetical protein
MSSRVRQQEIMSPEMHHPNAFTQNPASLPTASRMKGRPGVAIMAVGSAGE